MLKPGVLGEPRDGLTFVLSPDMFLRLRLALIVVSDGVSDLTPLQPSPAMPALVN